MEKAKRIRKKDKPAPHESSSEEENDDDTLGLNDHDSDPDEFDNNVNPEDDKSTLGDGRQVRGKRSLSTPSTGVLGISNDRMINIHLKSNRRGSLDSATFTAENMQQFINELDAAPPLPTICRGRYDLNLTALAARDMITIDMLAQKFVKLPAPQLLDLLRKLYPMNTSTRFQPLNERWAAVGARISSFEAIRLNVAMGPTNTPQCADPSRARRAAE